MPVNVASLTAVTLTLLPQLVYAQVYVVWSSVILTRTGERTPLDIGNGYPTLTTTGANQLYDVGTSFRNRYVTTNGQASGIEFAPLVGINPDFLDVAQVYATALDDPWNAASAQAFLQGFYPPYSPNSRNGSTEGQNPNAILANSSYIDAPLNGYQYAQVHTLSPFDWYQPLLGGSFNCPAWENAAQALTETADFQSTLSDSAGLYDTVGTAVLEGILDSTYWTYENAYQIYDYLSYQYAHNATAKALLDRYRDVTTNTSYLDMLRWLADRQQLAQLANLSAVNNANYNGSLGNTIEGSVSTIAGNMLAANVMIQFEQALVLAAEDQEYSQINIMFADFQPFVSFFALAGLPEINSYFNGLPLFGASIAFELFSYSNTSTPTEIPDLENMYVRFLFRNGTTGDFQSYSLFGNGPDDPDLTWSEFQEGMSNIALYNGDHGTIGEWCLSCNAQQLFCAAFNTSLADTNAQGSARPSVASVGAGVGPAVGGVIGGVVALAVAGLVLAGAMLFGGLRFHRVERRRGSDLGGFKGGRKMASDQDLTIPKGGAIVTKEEAVSPISPLGHERIGSWELNQHGLQNNASPLPQQMTDNAHASGYGIDSTRDMSFDEERVDPLRDAVKPREEV